jgi:hypothetical protein
VNLAASSSSTFGSAGSETGTLSSDILAAILGGRIGARNGRERGSVFELSLPAVMAH